MVEGVIVRHFGDGVSPVRGKIPALDETRCSCS
jgi:hypothetical protein